MEHKERKENVRETAAMTGKVPNGQRREAKLDLSREMLSMMKGATVADWLWLFMLEEQANDIYEYIPETWSLVCCEVGDYPWPVLWLLSRYHKHIFGASRNFRISQRWRLP